MYRPLRRMLSLCLLAAVLPSSPVHAAMSTPGQFSVSESGAATYSIPIQMPPGTAGIAPKLALSYNSNSGNGLLGMGWSLSGLSAVSRCPQTMAQDGVRGSVNFDANDRYCLDGQRLLAVTGTYGANGTEYRTEQEGFAKIVSYGTSGNGPAWFKVWTKSGQIMEYGNTADSRIEPQGKSMAGVWALNKLQDTKGNYFTVTYTEDNANGDYYPSRIDYTGNANTGTTPNNSVQFQYAARPDITPLYHAGSLIKNTVRMTRVQTYTSNALIKDYRLAYRQGQLTQRSSLLSLQECDQTGTCLPQQTFTWADSGTYQFPSNYAWTSPSGYGIGYQSILADFNGDGKTDIYLFRSSDGTHAVWLNQGDGTFLNSYAWTSPSGYGRGYEAMVGDFNGDGKTDIYIFRSSDGTHAVWLNQGNGTFSNSYAWDSPPGYGRGYQAMVGDFNGDGKADIYLFRSTDGNHSVWLNQGNGTFSNSYTWDSPPGYGIGYQAMVGDFNGDGKTDIYIFRSSDGTQAVWLNKGDGTFTNTYNWDPPGGYGIGYQAMLGDFNGDGRMDIYFFRSSDGTHAVWLDSSQYPDILTSISNGLGATTTISYRPITSNTVYTKDSGTNAVSYPLIDLQAPMYVVSSVTSSNGIGGTLTTNYTYGGLKADMTGRGSLGFRWTQAVQAETGLTSRTEYRQDYPYIGLPSLMKKTLAGGGNSGLLSQVTNTYGCTDFVSPSGCTVVAGRRYFPYVSQSTETSWDLNGAALPTIISSSQYDAWGNPTQIVVSTGDGYTKTTTNTYVNDTTNWFLGRLQRASVTSVTP